MLPTYALTIHYLQGIQHKQTHTPATCSQNVCLIHSCWSYLTGNNGKIARTNLVETWRQQICLRCLEIQESCRPAQEQLNSLCLPFFICAGKIQSSARTPWFWVEALHSPWRGTFPGRYHRNQAGSFLEQITKSLQNFSWPFCAEISLKTVRDHNSKYLSVHGH